VSRELNRGSDLLPERYAGNLYFAYLGANAASGALFALEAAWERQSFEMGLVLLLVMPLWWALFGQLFTPIVLGHLLTEGPRVVSHDLLAADVVGRGLLFVLCVLLAVGVASRRSLGGRVLSYVATVTVTLAVGVNMVSWIRQGL